MRGNAWAAAILLVAGVAMVGIGRAVAAPVEVQSVFEGRTEGADGVEHDAVLLLGRGVKGVESLLLEPQDASAPEVTLRQVSTSGKTIAVFADEDDELEPGTYFLRLRLKNGQTQDVRDIEIRAGGLHPSLVISTSNLDAYADLLAESRIGGSPSQVAPGNHLHDADYPRKPDLSSPGVVNSLANPVDWSRLKSVPAEIADGDDATVDLAGNGTAATAAKSDHEHDARYPTLTALAATGTLNASSNPVDWTQLKGVPAAFSDGTDDGASYAAGDGLSLASGTFSVNFAGNGSTSSSARSDHEHDGRYFTQAQISTPGGVLNTATNPLDWSRLKSVPAGFADGTDDGVTFAGSGTATTASRSDHDHSTAYLSKTGDTMTGLLTVATSGACITASASSSSSTYDVLSAAAQGDNGRGVVGTSTGAGKGVYGSNSGTGSGVHGYATGTGPGVAGYTTSSAGGENRNVGVYGEGPKTGVVGWATLTSGYRVGGGFVINTTGGSVYAAEVMASSSTGTLYKIVGSGTVSTVMETRSGRRVLHAAEMPEAYFEDAGRGRLDDGHCRVELDPLFLDCITVDDGHRLLAFVQVEGDCNGVYVRTDATGFDVRELQGGTSDVEFSWRVLGKWKGNEHLRFEEPPGPLMKAAAASPDR